jgi:hypothetical protein
MIWAILAGLFNVNRTGGARAMGAFILTFLSIVQTIWVDGDDESHPYMLVINIILLTTLLAHALFAFMGMFCGGLSQECFFIYALGGLAPLLNFLHKATRVYFWIAQGGQLLIPAPNHARASGYETQVVFSMALAVAAVYLQSNFFGDSISVERTRVVNKNTRREVDSYDTYKLG